MLITITVKAQGYHEDTPFVAWGNAQVKYDTIGRHYFCRNWEKGRYERIGLKRLSMLLNVPSIEIASHVKHLQALHERNEKQKELQRSYDNAKDMVAYFAAMRAQYPKHEIIKAQEVYAKSRLWRLGHLLKLGIEEVKEDILASIGEGIGNLKEPQGATD